MTQTVSSFLDRKLYINKALSDFNLDTDGIIFDCYKDKKEMLIKALNIRNVVMALVVIGGVFMVPNTPHAAPRSVAEINANPQVLNGLRFSKTDMKRLDIQNVHIKGMVFDNIQADNSRFINVTFENCTFTLVNFQSCRFENVAFINCVIQGRGDPKDINNSTIFRYSVFKDVLFENTKMNNVIADNISGEGGYVYFRNMHEVSPRGGEGPILVGSDLHCCVVDSNFTKANFLIRGNNNTSFYARNSKFTKATLQSGHIYIENCGLKEMPISSTGTMVVTRSVLDGVNASSDKICYYAYNQYIDSRGIDSDLNQELGNDIFGYDGSEVYVLHKDSSPALLGFSAGRITATDINLHNPMLTQLGEPKYPLSLNLRNVRISGGYWAVLTVDSGKWENVSIEPTVLVDRVKLDKIQAFNLEYPKGEPWKKEGEFSLDITRVSKPFSWPEVRVPTPADMGLEWWPSEPGYRHIN